MSIFKSQTVPALACATTTTGVLWTYLCLQEHSQGGSSFVQFSPLFCSAVQGRHSAELGYSCSIPQPLLLQVSEMTCYTEAGQQLSYCSGHISWSLSYSDPFRREKHTYHCLKKTASQPHYNPWRFSMRWDALSIGTGTCSELLGKIVS